METPIKQFMKAAHAIRLTDEAKSRMRQRLTAHMRAHPLPVLSPYQRFIGAVSPFMHLPRVPVFALALMLVLVTAFGSATTFAAEGSLPGDPLYLLKVNVIEPVRGLLAVSTEAKTAWRVSVAEARLNEVEALASTQRLTIDEGKRSRERFDSSLQAVQSNIEKLSHENPEKASAINASFTASLNAHKENLDTIAIAASSTNTIEVRAFADHLRRQVDTTLGATTTTPDTSRSNRNNVKTRENRTEEKR
jgi:hypothetical protein